MTREEAAQTIYGLIIRSDESEEGCYIYSDEIKALNMAIEALKQPEILTYDEQCIFLAAMGREKKICETVDKKWDLPTKNSLIFTCEEIERKVKATLWRREE